MANTETINNSQVAELVRNNWGLHVEDVEFITEGVSTQNWHVFSGDEQFVFRDCGSFSDYAQFQCRVWNRLAEHEFPYEIPRPIRLDNGSQVLSKVLSNYIVYPYIEGSTPNTIENQDIGYFGAMVAAYHAIVRNMDWSMHTQLRSKDLLSPGSVLPQIARTVSRLSTKAQKLEVETEFIQRAGDFSAGFVSLFEGFDVASEANLTRIPCHGDFKPQNTIFRFERLVGLIDLGGVVIDPKILDIQHALATTTLDINGFDETGVRRFIAGYSSHEPLTDKDHTLIGPSMYADTLLRLCWQLGELQSDRGRVVPSDAEINLYKASYLGKLCARSELSFRDF